MKKMLALMGAISLTASSSVAVVACTPKAVNPKPDPSTYNNSLANLQGSAALIAKQAILADQHGYSYQTLQNKLGIKLAEKQVNNLKMTDKTYDSEDRGLDEYSTVNELNSRYFGNNTSLAKTELTENINLKGNLGNGKGAVDQALPENIAGILQLAMGIIPNLSTNILGNLLGSLGPIVKLPDLNDILGKTTVDVVALLADKILSSPAVVNQVNNAIDSVDVVQETQELSLTNINGAFIISIVNLVSLFQNSEYKPLAISTNTDVEENLKLSANTIVASLTNKEAIDTKAAGTENNIMNYIKIAKEAAKVVQLLQMQISLFDEWKDQSVISKNGMYLFGEESNQDFYKRVTKGKVSEKFVSGNINFKYLLTSIKYYLGSLGKESDPEGRKFQKFLFIFLGDGFSNISQIKDQKQTNSFSLLVNYMLEAYLTHEVIDNLRNTLDDLLVKETKNIIGMFPTTKVKTYLTNNDFKNLIWNLFFAMANDSTLENNALKTFIANTLNAGWILNGTLQSVGASAILKMLTANLYSLIYKGDLKTVTLELKIALWGVTVNIYDKIIDSIPGSRQKIDDLIGADTPLNLNNIAKVSLNKFMGTQNDVNKLGQYYLEKSIPEIINDVTGDFGIEETDTLRNLQSYGIYFQDFKDLFNNHILNNKYIDSNGKEQNGNLVSQILKNLPDLFNILGIKKGVPNDGTLWKFLIDHFLQPNHWDHELKEGINVTFKNKNKFAKNQSDLQKAFNELFNLGERNKLIFFNGTPEEGFENGAIISDEIIAKAKNTLSLEQLMATEETNKQVTTVNYYVNMGNEYVVVENNDLTVSKVKIDNRNEKQEVTDHLPELFKGVTRIYNKLNVTTDLSNEMNSGFIDETLYSWTYETPEMMNDGVSIKAQKMSVLYKNPKTNQQVRYNFKYSREGIDKVFNLDYMQKQ